jgi:Polysaccharide deacetylase.
MICATFFQQSQSPIAAAGAGHSHSNPHGYSSESITSVHTTPAGHEKESHEGEVDKLTEDEVTAPPGKEIQSDSPAPAEKDDSSKNGMEERKDGEDPSGKDSLRPIYLTFDDGPQSYTEDILDLLDSYRARATFFLLEPNMRKHPDIVRKIIRRGHQVGLHSVTHDKKKFYASPKSATDEMIKAQLTLEEITGVKTRLIRVPYGSVPHLTKNQLQALESWGFLMWDWNIDSNDWKLTDGSFVGNTIRQIETFKKDQPMIVLMHDRKATLDNLEKLLIYLTENGYSMEPLTEDMVPVHFLASYQ